MKKILHKLLFVGLLFSGFAMYSQTALPGTIEVENGDVSNNNTSTGTRNVVGSGNGGTNNIIKTFRKNSGTNGTIINHVSIATAGNYDFTFTYYKASGSNTLQIHSTDMNGGSSSQLASFTLLKNSDTGATTSSYGTQTVTGVALTTDINYITITSNNPAAIDLDNVIVSAAVAKPTITLTGSTPVVVTQGDAYVDAGATALGSDGVTDITGDIVVGGDIVDVNTIGSYTITYNVTDGGVAADEVTRIVNVIAPQTTATQNGDWNDTATWGGDPVPGASDDVFVPDGFIVTVTDAQAANTIKVTNDANVRITTGGSLTVSGDIFLGRFDGGLELRNSSSSAALGTLIIDGSVQSMNSDDVTTSTSNKRIQVRQVLDNDKWYLFANVASTQPRVNRMTNDLRTNATPAYALGVYNNANADGAKYEYFSTSLANSDEVKLAQGMIVSVNGGAESTTGDFINKAFYSHNDANDIVRAINTDSGTNDAFNLVGNPYLANVYGNANANATNVLTQNAGILAEQTLWFWNSDTEGWVTKNQTGSFTIPPMTGFFVKSSPVGGDFTFTSAMETHADQGSVTEAKNTEDKFEIDLYVANGKVKRNISILFFDNATTSFDNGYDSSTFGRYSSSFEIYTNILENDSNKKLAIQSLPNTNVDQMIVPVGVSVEANSEITFTAEALNIPAGYNVYLEDRLNSTFTKLNEVDAEYQATVTENTTEGRFYIHVKASVLSVGSEILNSVKIFKSADATLKIVGLSQGSAQISLYNILGKQVLRSSFIANSTKEITLPKLTQGVYIVQLETENGSINKKIVLE